MHALSPPTVVEVSLINSNLIEVREGVGARVELFAQAFGLYATPIEIGVICAPVDVSIPAGADTISSTDTGMQLSSTLCLVVCSLSWPRLCCLKWKHTGVRRC